MLADVLYLIAPAYNEAENIEQFVLSWYPLIEEHSANGLSRLVVIDDGSKDETYTLLQALAEKHSLLIPITKRNGGHGAAVLYGYRFALDNDADYIFQTDSDGQTDPAEFAQFWENRRNFDAQFGNRVVRGDGKQRALVEKVVCLLVRLYFGSAVPDANAPFRLMSHDYVRDIIRFIPDDYALPNIVLTALGPRFGKTICFREISFKPRTTGKNSINMKRIVRIGRQALQDFASIRRTVKAHEASYVTIA